MLIFRNAILEYCLLPQGSRIMADEIAADGSCDCWVDEDNKNMRTPYSDGTHQTANISILLNQSSVGQQFRPAFVRYRKKRETEFSEWHAVKDVEWYDLVKSIRIVCL